MSCRRQNSVESTIGWSATEADGWWTRHNISANMSNYTLSDAYFPAFRTAIQDAGARGIMCSCKQSHDVSESLSPCAVQALSRRRCLHRQCGEWSAHLPLAAHARRAEILGLHGLRDL